MVNKIFFFGILFLIFIISFQISAQEELIDICALENSPIGCGSDLSLSGSNFNIDENGFVSFTGDQGKLIVNQGQENEIILEGTQGIEVNPITGEINFIEDGAKLSINGNSFENIKSGEILLDQNTGSISKAFFYTNENIGNYNINGNEFNVPANSHFFYDSKEGIFLDYGTEIKSLSSGAAIQIQGDNFIWENNKLSGALNFDENGNAFVKIGEKVIINGVSIENSGNKLYGSEANLLVFFDKDSVPSGQNEYVVFDSSKNLFAFQEQKESGARLANRQIKIGFNQDNYLFGDLMDEKDYILIGEGGATPGYLEITRSPGNLPIVKNQGEGDIELWQGGSRFNFKENDLSISKLDSYQYPEGKSGTVPMIIKTPGKIIEKDGKPEKIKGIIGFIRDDKEDEFKTFYFTYDEGEVKSLLAGGEYLKGDKLAEEKYVNDWKEISQVTYADMEDIVKQINNPQFISSLEKSKSADSFLTAIYNNPKISPDKVIAKKVGDKDFAEFMDLQKQLEKGAITQQQFANDLDALIKKTGKDPSISWTELEAERGKINAQNIKNAIKTKLEAYYYAGNPGKGYLERVLGTNELANLNNCMSAGGNFDNCFNQHYTRYGLLTDLCGKNNEYCPVLTASKFFSIGF